MAYCNREANSARNNDVYDTLYRSCSEFGPLEIIEDTSVRSLCFGNAVRQSSMSLADPIKLELAYTRAMLAVELFLSHPPQDILIIGLGGGSIAKHLHHYHPQAQIQVIELREDVVRVAYDYFKLPADPRLKLVIADGLEYMKSCEDQFDLIFVDMFDDDGMLEDANDPAFYQGCKRSLNKQGVLVANLWNIQKERYAAHTALYRKTFGQNWLKLPLANDGNEIQFGFGKKVNSQLMFYARSRIKAMEQEMGLDFSLYFKLLMKHNGHMK
jgi:spermidine synthase